MNRTRQDKINQGKLWLVYKDGELEHHLFEGSKTACMQFIRANRFFRQYRTGHIRLGKLIYSIED